jgi:hypothetical protein
MPALRWRYDPGRIADHRVGALLGAGEPDGTGKVSENEGPDAVASGAIQRLKMGKGLRQRVGVLSAGALDAAQRLTDSLRRRLVGKTAIQFVEAGFEGGLMFREA